MKDPARPLKFVAMVCVFASCLLTFHTSAFAIAIYEAFTEASVSAPGPLPSGTSIFFRTGFTQIAPQPFESGNAIATGFATSSPPGTASALVTGFASGPGNSEAISYGFGETGATLFNFNATAVTFPLTVSHQRTAHTSSIPFGGQTETASAQAYYTLFLDDTILVNNFGSICLRLPSNNNCSSFDSGSDSFLFGLTPGLHSLQLFAGALGSATATDIAATPEPMTLLLFGTTMVGLGLARWRRRKAS